MPLWFEIAVVVLLAGQSKMETESSLEVPPEHLRHWRHNHIWRDKFSNWK